MDEQTPIWERALWEARFLYVMWVITSVLVVATFALLLPVLSFLWCVGGVVWVVWSFLATWKWGRRIDYLRTILRLKKEQEQ